MKNKTFLGFLRTVGLTLAIVMLACTPIVLTSCNFLPQGYEGDASAQEEQTAPEIIISDKLNLPEYIQDLIELDHIYKYYSYDGIDEQTMKKAMLKAYIEATGDPYAEYLDAEEYLEYFSEKSGEFVGVGVSVVNTVIEISGYKYKVLQIVSVFKDSPALEAGLRAGDCVVYVGGGDERVLVDLIGYTEAVERIRGTEGTAAEFTVFRPSGSDYEEIEFSITRKKVVSSSVNYRVSETDKSIGIVNVTEFDDTTPVQFTEAVDTLKAQGCEYFVFDMRNNPGGALDSIETVLSYFLDKGDLIVSTEYSESLKGHNYSDYVRVKRYQSPYECYNVTAQDIGKYKDLKDKCVVLVNENTASAAELFTATFRDYELAKIVGKTTYGKGCMQTLFPLDDYGLEGGLKLTVAMYFSKSHTNYHGIGIKPDVEVDLSDEAKAINFFLLTEDKDDQMQAAFAELLK